MFVQTAGTPKAIPVITSCLCNETVMTCVHWPNVRLRAQRLAAEYLFVFKMSAARKERYQ